MNIQRPQIALIGLSILLLASIFHGFSQGKKLYSSLNEWAQIRPLWQRLEAAPQLITDYQQQLQEKESSVPPALNDPLELVQYLESQSKDQNLRLLRLPKAILKTEASTQIQESSFSLEGSLPAILQLVYRIEQVDRLGQITTLHLACKRQKRARSKQRILLAHLNLQQTLSP